MRFQTFFPNKNLNSLIFQHSNPLLNGNRRALKQRFGLLQSSDRIRFKIKRQQSDHTLLNRFPNLSCSWLSDCKLQLCVKELNKYLRIKLENTTRHFVPTTSTGKTTTYTLNLVLFVFAYPSNSLLD